MTTTASAPGPLVPRARRASRAVVLVATLAGALPRTVRGAQAQQALVLAALALGMPHGAADTELLLRASHGSRRRHLALLTGYAALAAGSTAVVHRGGEWVERGVLVASAAHFAEGELACWGAAPAGRPRARAALRLLAAAVATVGLPAAVGTASPGGHAAVGVSGVHDAPRPRAVGDRSGLALLGDPRTRRAVGVPAALAVAAVGALAASGDREAAADTARLTALALLAPPSLAFAGYFGGWHALRHTARVTDALVAGGQLTAPSTLPGAIAVLGRRSAWAALVGLVGAGVLAARDPARASDNAFAAVLGLTVPHMTTVALELARPRQERGQVRRAQPALR